MTPEERLSGISEHIETRLAYFASLREREVTES